MMVMMLGTAAHSGVWVAAQIRTHAARSINIFRRYNLSSRNLQLGRAHMGMGSRGKM
jgi:hypothetical protein